jgi:hypothetical protein
MRFNVEVWREGEVAARLPINTVDVDGRGQFVIEDLAPGTYKLELISWRSDPAGGGIFPISRAEQRITVAGEGRHEVTMVVDLTLKEREK